MYELALETQSSGTTTVYPLTLASKDVYITAPFVDTPVITSVVMLNFCKSNWRAVFRNLSAPESFTITISPDVFATGGT
jgi:hypothetical protein